MQLVNSWGEIIPVQGYVDHTLKPPAITFARMPKDNVVIGYVIDDGDIQTINPKAYKAGESVSLVLASA